MKKTGPNGGRKPKWWTEKLESSWSKVKAEALADWEKTVGVEKKIEHSVAAEAIAFGHGAREAYKKMQVWGSELEDKLKADWKEIGSDAESAWDKVSAAVRRGWERATSPEGAAKPAVPLPDAKFAKGAPPDAP